MNDDIGELSAALAADPSSIVFVRLGELLRQRGDLDVAYRVATRGLQRHPQRVDAHDLVARISVDRADDDRARNEWELVLAMQPGHVGAQKGLGFVCYRHGDFAAADRYLSGALAAEPADASLVAALATVRARLPVVERSSGPRDRASRVITPPAGHMVAPAPPFAPPPAVAYELFVEALGDFSQTALLLDRDGYVIAGRHLADRGEDRSADIGAQLSGVSEEADRTVEHLGLGRWTQLVFEADAASVAMAPLGGGVVLLAAPRSVPLGLVRRLLDRALERARRWMESGT